MLLGLSILFIFYVLHGNGEETSSDIGIYLSINPLAYTLESGEVVKRRLEITWYGAQIEPETRVLLRQNDQDILEIQTQNYPDGFYTTDIILPRASKEELIAPSCMFGYSASMLDAEGTELAEACLRNEPRWQSDNREALAKMKIGSMMLTGTHDAGAYKEYEFQGDDNLVTSATFAQEETLLSQLLWGVRFLDMRIAYYPSLEEKFWIVHGIIKAHPAREEMAGVKEFLRASTDIMVFELNNFNQPTWDDEAHQEWKKILLEEFSRWLVTPGDLGWDTTLEDIWNREGLPENEGRIIITYNDYHTDPQLFFPEVLEKWGDVDEVADLRRYLDNQIAMAADNPRYQPWKPNCQLTPTTEDILGGRWSGLREMADAANRNVTRWWREDWPDLTSTFTVHDFVLSTDMIRESIRRNLRIAEATQVSGLWSTFNHLKKMFSQIL